MAIGKLYCIVFPLPAQLHVKTSEIHGALGQSVAHDQVQAPLHVGTYVHNNRMSKCDMFYNIIMLGFQF